VRAISLSERLELPTGRKLEWLADQPWQVGKWSPIYFLRDPRLMPTRQITFEPNIAIFLSFGWVVGNPEVISILLHHGIRELEATADLSSLCSSR
jgi:hypothetical protein